MQTMPARIFFVLVILALICPSVLPAAPEQRVALVIGNSAYSSGPLKNPVNDATDMAAMLQKLGFSVTLRKDAGLQEMDEAIEAFGNRLKRGGVGLFYYAGHGLQVNGTNYLLPIGAKINKETDVKYQAVDANRILDEMATANNGLNIVVLDACRDNPFARSFRSATRGLAIVSSAPSGTFISYSTSPGNVARDGDGRNSPYTAALLQNMQTPGLALGDVFINVRTKVKKETGQVPWELSSLEGQFYFNPQGARQNNPSEAPSAVKKSAPQPESEALARQREALEREKQDLERDRREIERMQALEAERKKLEAERNELANKKKLLSEGSRPSPSALRETGRDERFAANDNRKIFVLMETSLGAVKLELFAKDAPVSVRNFLDYVNSGFYDGTVYHRVIPNFMIQGGGFTADMKQKQTNPPIPNEADNGLKNLPGTLAMARTAVVDSATSQFFINLVDNSSLNHRDKTPQGYGYAVFGRVSEGMDVVAKIAAVKTGTLRSFQNVPETSVVIKSMKILP